MSKLRKFLMVILLPVLCLSLMVDSFNVSAAAKQTKTPVTKLSTASANDDFEDFIGIWKYDDSNTYIVIEDAKWTGYSAYGTVLDTGSYAISGDVITLKFESDGSTDSYTLNEDGKLVDVGGGTLSKVDSMELLPTSDDKLTEMTSFPDKFSDVDIYYPKSMSVYTRKEVAHALNFYPINGKGTVDYYSSILVMFQPLKPEFDKDLKYGSAIGKKIMGFMLENFVDLYYGKHLVKSIGSDFKDCGSYYSIKGYLWFDGDIYETPIDYPVRGVVELRYYGPTGYSLATVTIATEKRIENYAKIAEKMLDSCTYKNDWTTAPKAVPKKPGKAKSSKKSSSKSAKKSGGSDSGDYGAAYYWTDEDGDIWYWNGYDNQFMSYGSDGYIDDDGSYYESNDYGWGDAATYYDDYDPYDEWSDYSYDYDDYYEANDYGYDDYDYGYDDYDSGYDSYDYGYTDW